MCIEAWQVRVHIPKLEFVGRDIITFSFLIGSLIVSALNISTWEWIVTIGSLTWCERKFMNWSWCTKSHDMLLFFFFGDDMAHIHKSNDFKYCRPLSHSHCLYIVSKAKQVSI